VVFLKRIPLNELSLAKFIERKLQVESLHCQLSVAQCRPYVSIAIAVRPLRANYADRLQRLSMRVSLGIALF
jgi:hypothetical protein